MATTKPQTKKSPQPSTIRIGNRYRSSRLNGPYDAIVIGSGMGGLATAACMSKAGKKVLVLEQHYTAGGYTHSYSRNGYEWDVGVHYIGDVGHKSSSARKMFDFITNSQLEWAPMDDVYDRFYFGGEQYDLKAGKQAFIDGLIGYFPNESKAINRYVEMLSEVANAMPAMSVEKFLPELANKFWKPIKNKIAPDFINKTTYEVLSSLTSNQELIAVLTGQWGDCGMPPKSSSFLIHALIAKHYIYGGYYPIGGASRIAETVIPVIQESGGDVMTYAVVEEIVIEKDRATGVRMKDGTIISAPIVISNAGVFNTFQRLVSPEVSKKHGYDKKLQTVKRSMAHLGMYIGLKGTSEELGLPKTNFWIYPNYTPDENVEKFKKDQQAEFPVVYISFPSSKDPSWDKRYPGKSTIEIVAPTTYDLFAPWKDETWGKRGDDYDALKEQFSERLLEYVYEKLPHLRGKIDYYELSTPLSTDYFCYYPQGEIYGIEHDPSRFEQTWLKPKTNIKGLYLTGQDVLSCGVVGALMAGLGTAVAVLGLSNVKLAKSMFFGAEKAVAETKKAQTA
ncbi:MAG: NAD(P)/FAD-dependent oxidoreductase [Hahellaceae bacterium]|jgi:all-trans-retinol 13,14-reductase|nr:NAD(P)/FAD-dependent oxidoreductase [Hahellaceae bacterium]MCP5211433.1 NAD(P)/FAD-dependent oxidoreductase [Hahellaceae bacterium]